MDCSIAKNYLAEKARMIQANKSGECDIYCIDGCLLSKYSNGKGIGCTDLEVLYPEEAVKLIQKWSDEHPLKTMRYKFFELFPNAPRNEETGDPLCCPMHLGWGEHECSFNGKCSKCWGRPYEEE